jgi:hypothetical protein
VARASIAFINLQATDFWRDVFPKKVKEPFFHPSAACSLLLSNKRQAMRPEVGRVLEIGASFGEGSTVILATAKTKQRTLHSLGYGGRQHEKEEEEVWSIEAEPGML